jgi:hypothetical protein
MIEEVEKPMRFSLLKVIICVIVALLAQAAYPAAKGKLITSVNNATLFQLLHVKQKAGQISVPADYVSYAVMTQGSGVVSDVTIGVYPTVAHAGHAFRNFVRGIRIRPARSITAHIAGDEMACWAAKSGNRGWPGRCLMRRANCVISFGYSGQLSDMIKLANKLDHALINSPRLAPMGSAVAIPEVTLSAPTTFRIGGNGAIKVHSKPGSPIRTCDGRTADLVENNEVRFFRTAADCRIGSHTVEIVMATPGNVIFSKNVTILVIAK